MDKLKATHNQNLINAWNKICDWCKENLSDIIPGGMAVRFPFQPFGWTSFAVTQDGEVQVHSGSHGDSSTTVVTREYIHRLDSRYVEGKIVRHSRFFDNTSKPVRDTVSYRLAGGTEPITTGSNLCLIEETVRIWVYLKDRLLEVKEQSEALKDFQP